MTALGFYQNRTIQRSSPIAIQSALQALAANFPSNRWTSVANPYAATGGNQISSVLKSGKELQTNHVLELMAASAPTHCADGWSYLGGAISAALAGQAEVSRHLAYYAELRAAMSTLVAAGVGILDRDHVVVDANTELSIISGIGTHAFAWEALTAWVDTPAAAIAIGRAIRPGNIPLTEWLDAFTAKQTAQQVARSWLGDWGIDLERLAEDRDARNVASYHPSRLVKRAECPTPTIAKLVAELWQVCQPQTSSRFEILDRYLLRAALRTQYDQSIHGPLTQKKRGDFKQRVKQIFSTVNAPGGQSAWTPTLNDFRLASNLMILDYASRKDDQSHPEHHLQAICRAILLLRLASGNARHLLSSAGLTATDLQFWWEPLGIATGIWTAGSPINDIPGLWNEVGPVANSAGQWASKNANTKPTPHIRELEHAVSPITLLSTTARIGLWGMGL